MGMMLSGLGSECFIASVSLKTGMVRGVLQCSDEASTYMCIDLRTLSTELGFTVVTLNFRCSVWASAVKAGIFLHREDWNSLLLGNVLCFVRAYQKAQGLVSHHLQTYMCVVVLGQSTISNGPTEP